MWYIYKILCGNCIKSVCGNYSKGVCGKCIMAYTYIHISTYMCVLAMYIWYWTWTVYSNTKVFISSNIIYVYNFGIQHIHLTCTYFTYINVKFSNVYDNHISNVCDWHHTDSAFLDEDCEFMSAKLGTLLIWMYDNYVVKKLCWFWHFLIENA